MVRIVKTEFYKLKRYHILWAGVALMLLSVLLTLFTSMANDGSVWDFAYLTEQVIKNNMSMIFPMCISSVSYTHLDVYKRQSVFRSFKSYASGELVKHEEQDKAGMGYTLYIGSLKSEVYFCVYEKS